MQLKLKLILAGAATIIAAGCTSPEAHDIRLANYNIQICRGVDKQLDPDRTAAAIAALNAETVALNEVDRMTDRSDNIDEPKYLAEKLGMDFAFGKAFAQPGGDYGNAVISKYPVQIVEIFEIPGNGTESRGAMIAKIMAPEPYFVAVTHLPFERYLETARAEGIARILAKLKEHNAYPALLMGDLNSPPDGAAVNTLRDAGFTVVNDAYPDEKTWPADHPRLLLDYIAFYPAGAFKVKEHFVADDPASSDHRAVVTVLSK